MKIAKNDKIFKNRRILTKSKLNEDKDSEKDEIEILKCKTPPPLKFIKSNSPTFTISTSTRFTNNIFEKFKSKINADISFYFKSKSKSILKKTSIRSNKNMKQHSPIEKSAKLKKMSIMNDSRQQMTKLSKFSIVKQKKEYYQQKLDEKFKKLFFRQGKKEFSNIFRSWMTLFCIFGQYKVIKAHLVKIRLRKARTKAFFKQFTICTVFIGRILHRLNYIKRKLTVKVRNKQKLNYFVKFCRRWLNKRQKMHQKNLVQFADIFLNKYVSRRLIEVFNSRVIDRQIIFIQKNLKIAVKHRVSLIQKLVEMWNEQEEQMFNNLISRDSKKKHKKAKVAFREISLIPLPYKIQKIVKKIKGIVAEYIVEMKKYKSGLQLKKHISKMKWLKDSHHSFNKPIPKSPSILQGFTKEVLISMISKAMKKRRSPQNTRKAPNQLLITSLN